RDAAALVAPGVASSAGTAQPDSTAIATAIHGILRLSLALVMGPCRSRGIELTASNSKSVIMLHLPLATSSLPHVELVTDQASSFVERRHLRGSDPRAVSRAL